MQCSYDGAATAAAVSELQQNLTLGKIEKIYQPHSEQLIFNIHTKAGRKKLLLSVSGNHAGAYLTKPFLKTRRPRRYFAW